ncbi:MAG: hypothetical protein IJO08_04980 [Clostridia bacterium]|nr:hypothetical protein [Clostridia bacterium]
MHRNSMYNLKSAYRKALVAENAEWTKLARIFDVVIATPTAINEPEYDITSFCGLAHYVNSSYDLCNNDDVAAFMFFPKVKESHPKQPSTRFADEIKYPSLWGAYYRDAARYHRHRLDLIKKFVATIIATKEGQMT